MFEAIDGGACRIGLSDLSNLLQVLRTGPLYARDAEGSFVEVASCDRSPDVRVMGRGGRTIAPGPAFATTADCGQDRVSGGLHDDFSHWSDTSDLICGPAGSSLLAADAVSVARVSECDFLITGGADSGLMIEPGTDPEALRTEVSVSDVEASVLGVSDKVGGVSSCRDQMTSVSGPVRDKVKTATDVGGVPGGSVFEHSAWTVAKPATRRRSRPFRGRQGGSMPCADAVSPSAG